MRHHTRRAIRAAQRISRALAAAACGLRAYLAYAAETGLSLVIGYAKEDGTASTRTITPNRVWPSKAGHWCVRAHDQLRGTDRTFRLDRITALETA